MTRIYVAVMALSLFTSTTNAFAEGVPEGTYSGAVSDGGHRVAAIAQFADQSVILRFGEPYKCSLAAVRSEIGSAGDRYIFGPAPNGGAFCQQLLNKALAVKMLDRGVFISFAGSGVEWSGSLAK